MIVGLGVDVCSIARMRAALERHGDRLFARRTRQSCHATPRAPSVALANASFAANLEVAAGHGLTQANVVALMGIPEIVELNIGHAVVSDAVFCGLREAVRAFGRAVDVGVAARG